MDFKTLSRFSALFARRFSPLFALFYIYWNFSAKT